MNGFRNIKTRLEERAADGLYRRRRVIDSAQGRILKVDDTELLNFCSNDYLGLANDVRVRDSFREAAHDWGVGSGASHLVSGHTRIHEELEEALAEFTGRPRALLFSSGYAANLGTINGLLGKGDQILEDRLNHASLLDGGQISGARFRRYAHRNIPDLSSKLDQAASAETRTLVVSDGTFSMDGTVCDIEATSEIAKQHDAWLMIDEAHSLGVIGNQGRGLVDAASYTINDVQILIGTLGKALGTQGGFVAGSEELIETLIQSARTYIYSTALPSAVAAATLTSLAIAQAEEWRREQLHILIKRFRSGAAQLGLELLDSSTPIQPVILGAADDAVRVSQALEREGLLITAIRPPTVPAGSSRLRITFTAEHTEQDIDMLLAGLEKVAP